MFRWDFRFKNAKGMLEDIQIETFTADEREAVELGNKRVDKLASPAARLVYVKPAIGETSADYPDLVAKYRDAPAVDAVPKDAPELPDRVPGMSGDLEPGPIVDAPFDDGVDNEMSGPRVAKPRAPRARVGA